MALFGKRWNDYPSTGYTPDNSNTTTNDNNEASGSGWRINLSTPPAQYTVPERRDTPVNEYAPDTEETVMENPVQDQAPEGLTEDLNDDELTQIESNSSDILFNHESTNTTVDEMHSADENSQADTTDEQEDLPEDAEASFDSPFDTDQQDESAPQDDGFAADESVNLTNAENTTTEPELADEPDIEENEEDGDGIVTGDESDLDEEEGTADPVDLNPDLSVLDFPRLTVVKKAPKIVRRRHPRLKTVKKMRTEKGITQKAMADKMHISPQFYSCLERGENTLSITNALKLSKILKKKVEDLFGEDLKEEL